MIGLIAHDVLQLGAGTHHHVATLQAEDRAKAVIEPNALEDGVVEDQPLDELFQGTEMVDLVWVLSRQVKLGLDFRDGQVVRINAVLA
jgi:hypothetical protein